LSFAGCIDAVSVLWHVVQVKLGWTLCWMVVDRTYSSGRARPVEAMMDGLP
jgi:hypothetical protein